MNILLTIIGILLLLTVILFMLLRSSYRRFNKPDGIFYIDTSDEFECLYRLKMNEEVDKIKEISYVVLQVDPSADLHSIKVD